MRKRGNNKRQPRTVGPKEACISYNVNDPDNARTFVPKAKEPRKGIKMVKGKYMRYEKERALQ